MRAVAAGVGFGAGATFVRAGPEEPVVLHAARILLYHLLQSVVVELVLVVVFTAPGDVPELSRAAVRHAALFALPDFVQS